MSLVASNEFVIESISNFFLTFLVEVLTFVVMVVLILSLGLGSGVFLAVSVDLKPTMTSTDDGGGLSRGFVTHSITIQILHQHHYH